jgi:hypothetical protein|tara:strand:+ start:3666 stop:4172 length:507 start_codon:yes stop_codon:yes gene_type:complete
MTIRVVDNFLPKKEFIELKKLLLSNNFPYFFNNKVVLNKKVSQKDNYFFVHLVYNDELPGKINSPYFDYIKKIILNKLNIKKLIRVKINCYPKTSKKIQHGFHKDYPYKHNGLILSINTCNGSTTFKSNKKIVSIENKALFFDPSKLHGSTTCTDQQCRINIAINYIN